MIAFRRILCPVDFSAATESGIRPAAAIASLYSADVTLLHAVHFPYESVALERMYLEVEDSARLRLADLENLCRDHDGKTESAVVRDGTPYEVIIEFAHRQNIDLIVQPTHSRAGLDRLMFGSVTERVARTSECPVLAVPPGATGDFDPTTILFATDFSTYSDHALPYAASLARHFDARLLLTHVVTLAERGEFSEGWKFPNVPANVEEQALAHATEGLLARGAQARDGAIRTETKLVRGTYPALEIAELADAADAGLIVVASHGHSVVVRALLGSTAEKLIRCSNVPVLIVRPMD